MRAIISNVIFFLILAPCIAQAQFECAGKLTQKDFYQEIKELNGKIQKNVIEYRKLEQSAANQQKGSPEAAASAEKMKQLRSELDTQKKQFEELNSKYFPTTEVTALGAACRDRRWVEHAKERLLANPDKLGRRFFVWLEKGSRAMKASEERPALEVVAE